MKEYVGDIWRWARQQHPAGKTAIVIPTNGTVKQNCECVMGTGLAKIVATKFPAMALQLGRCIHSHGNIAMLFRREGIITFPVKHHWTEKANLALIARSCRQLNEIIRYNKLMNVGVPHVGCGNGKLSWEDVRPILISLLDEECTIITEFEEESHENLPSRVVRKSSGITTTSH